MNKHLVRAGTLVLSPYLIIIALAYGFLFLIGKLADYFDAVLDDAQGMASGLIWRLK